MLCVNLSGLSDPEVAGIIAEACSRYGAVKDIEIAVKVDHKSYFVAMVEMSSLAETLLVRQMIGDSMFGNFALIRVGKAPLVDVESEFD